MRRWVALLAALVAAPAAFAVPPDERLVLAPGAERFLKPPFAARSLVVDPPGFAAAEVQPSGEIFVTARAPGAAVLLVAGRDRVHVWELCVADSPADCPRETSILEAKKACPDLREGSEDGTRVWMATVSTPACAAALREALVHAPRLEMRLVMEEAAALDLYRRVGAALSADPVSRGLSASWMGPTLRLSGRAEPHVVARALLHAWRETAGYLSFENRVVPPAP